MPTRRGAALLLTGVLLSVLARLLGVAALMIVSVAGVALVGLALVGVRLGTRALTVQRQVSAARLPWGGTATVALTLRNGARLPTGVLLLDDESPAGLTIEPPRFLCPSLRPGGAVTVRYHLEGVARGRHRIGPLRVGIRDPFGLAERIWRSTAHHELVVYPQVEALSARPAHGAHRGTGASEDRRLLETGDEFYGLREYTTGDDVRRIHWPTSARQATLMIRQQEQPWDSRATVFCDTRAGLHGGAGSSPTLESAISAAASIIWHLADRRFELRLVTETDVRLPAPAHWSLLLDRLAELTPSPMAHSAPAVTRLRESGGGLLVAVLAPPAPAPAGAIGADPDLRALLAAGRTFSRRLALVTTPASPRSGGARRNGHRAAEELTTTLQASGWRAATLPAETPTAEAWAGLTAPLARRREVSGR